MTIDFFIAKGNRLPSIQDTLKDSLGAPLDLSSPVVTGVTFSLKDFATDTVKISAQSAVVVTPLLGLVRYDWSVGDGNLAVGFYYGRWRITYADGKFLDVPNDGQIIIKITQPVA